MGRQKLSVIVPCYNEEKTLRIIVEKILEADVLGLDLEVLIIDDGSRDRSLEISKKLIREHDNVKLFQHQRNMGKGAAIANGIGIAKGDIVLIQDADLEYDPSEYPDLLKPILDLKHQLPKFFQQ